MKWIDCQCTYMYYFICTAFRHNKTSNCHMSALTCRIVYGFYTKRSTDYTGASWCWWRGALRGNVDLNVTINIVNIYNQWTANNLLSKRIHEIYIITWNTWCSVWLISQNFQQEVSVIISRYKRRCICTVIYVIP